MIKNLIKNGKSLLSTRQTSILSAAFIMMVTVFASRILGLIRDRLLAYFFSPHELGIYFAAFRIPDMIFSILVMGALSTAFIPVITDYLTKKDKDTAWKISSSVINIGMILFFVVATIFFIFSYSLSTLIAPGFNRSELLIVSSLTRIMLLAQFFFIISNFLTGILQSEKSFILPALAPVVYNIGIIIGIIVLTPFIGLYGPAIGVVLGAFLHFIIQIPPIKSLGYNYKPKIELNLGVKRIGKLMLPRTIGLIASQLNFTIDNILASLIAPSAITVFNFAQHLQQLPIGLFGATIAQAALPTLSEENSRQNLDNFKNTFQSSFMQILFLTIPATIVLIVLRVPLVRLVFGAVKFDWEATVFTGLTLTYFSFGVIFQSLIHLFARAFYSLSDSKTPLFICLITVIVNIIFSLLLVYFLKLPVWGLAISSSVADFLNAIFLFILLDRKVGNLIPKEKIILPILKIILASLWMGIGIYLSVKFFDLFVLDTTRTINLLFLTLTSFSVGLIIFILISWWLKIEEATAFKKLISRSGRILELLKQPVAEITPQE